MLTFLTLCILAAGWFGFRAIARSWARGVEAR